MNHHLMTRQGQVHQQLMNHHTCSELDDLPTVPEQVPGGLPVQVAAPDDLPVVHAAPHVGVPETHS